MRPVIVLAKKVGRENGRIGFANYVNKLSKKVFYSQGFISTNSYWKCWDFSEGFENKSEIKGGEWNYQAPTLITISQWTSHNDWYQWYHSEERENIKKLFSNDIELEHFTILRKQRKPNDIFLL